MGATLRNRTVDLLLTMDRCAVLQPQVDSLTCQNASTAQHSRALDQPTQAPFATQSATHFDLAAEPSYEVADIKFEDRAVSVHGLSPRTLWRAIRIPFVLPLPGLIFKPAVLRSVTKVVACGALTFPQVVALIDGMVPPFAVLAPGPGPSFFSGRIDPLG